MTVRRATADDVEAVREVAGDSWEADYPDILSRESVESGVEEWYDRDRVRAALDADDELLLVAERGDGTDGESAGERAEGGTGAAGDRTGVAGFAHAVVDGDRSGGHLLRLYVHPDSRGEGVGGRLLAAVRDELFGRGVDRITATVLAGNGPGNEFYRAFGFEPDGEAETTVAGESYPENRYVLERT